MLWIHLQQGDRFLVGPAVLKVSSITRAPLKHRKPDRPVQQVTIIVDAPKGVTIERDVPRGFRKPQHEADRFCPLHCLPMFCGQACLTCQRLGLEVLTCPLSQLDVVMATLLAQGHELDLEQSHAVIVRRVEPSKVLTNHSNHHGE
jgi:hypothetical protein